MTLPGRYISKSNAEQMYMNIHTGTVSDYDGWYFEIDDQTIHNAVDREEVIPVIWVSEPNSQGGFWEHGKVQI